jgi:hypothetical protein
VPFVVRAYVITLFAHSYVRWVALLAGALALGAAAHGLVSRRSWTKVDDRLSVVLVAATDLQLLLGLLLHLWLSPIARAALEGGGDRAAANAPLWFFGYVHPVAMFVGFLVVHIGRARSRRAEAAPAKFRALAWALGVWMITALAAMPWPWLSYGRPLLRWGS